MSDPNQARGRSRKGLSVDFKGLRLYDHEGNVEYHHHPSTPSNKGKETHRGRSGREQSPRRRRVEETESHHHRKDHGRHGSGHHNVHQETKQHSHSKNREHSRHRHRRNMDGTPAARDEQTYGIELPTEKSHNHGYDGSGYDRIPHTLKHQRSVSMGAIPININQGHHHRYHDHEEGVAGPSRHHGHHHHQEGLGSSSRRHRSQTVHEHSETINPPHYHNHEGEGVATSSSRHRHSHRVDEPSHMTQATYDRGYKSEKRSKSVNREELRAVYIPVTQAMYDVRADLAGTGISIKDVYAAGEYTKGSTTMYYHVDLDKWLAHPPSGPSRTPEKGKHARHRSIERLVDIDTKVYKKVKEHVEAGSDELARGWQKSSDNLTDAQKTAIRQAEKNERWAEAVRKNEKIARRSSRWDECFGDS